MESLNEKKTVLIVDDTPNNLRLLSQILAEAGYHVRATASSKQALGTAISNPPDLILLDVMMPEMNGYELCRRLREEPLTKDVPILFLSAMSESDAKIKGFVCGGQDYIAKPFDPYEVVARVETHLSLRLTKQKLEKVVSELKNVLKEKEELVKELEIMAHTDGLTGVNNRSRFFSLAEHEFNGCFRYHQTLSVIMIDIDHFKRLNDTYGHAAGDFVLKETSSAIKKNLRKADVLARYGGEEFIILLPMSPIAQVQIVAERIRESVESMSIAFNCQMLTTTISLGASEMHKNDTKITDIIERADKALYAAKNMGRNRAVCLELTDHLIGNDIDETECKAV